MEIKTHKINNDWIQAPIRRGWGNGYIGLPPEHPWFGKHYNSIPIEVHGGLTYAENHLPKLTPDGLWWIGFDTFHRGDNLNIHTESFVDKEIESIKEQALKAVKT